jgi:dihydrofolate reductase
MIAIVAAVGRNGAIGYQGGLPWKLPEDLQHFRDLTIGHLVIMGRGTLESIGMPLPHRDNVVVTSRRIARSSASVPEVVTAVYTLGEALRHAAHQNHVGLLRTTFVIGGARLFAQATPLADYMYLTDVDLEAPADTFWTPDLSGYQEIERRAGKTPGLTFVTWERVNSRLTLPDGVEPDLSVEERHDPAETFGRLPFQVTDALPYYEEGNR